MHPRSIAMKNCLILLGLFSTCVLYGQMHHDMSSPSPKIDHSQMQGMDHSKMQDMPMQNKREKETHKDRNGAKNEDQPKGVLRYPSVITPNVDSLPWKMDG